VQRRDGPRRLREHDDDDDGGDDDVHIQCRRLETEDEVCDWLVYCVKRCIRVVRGSIVCDPIQPNLSADRPDPTRGQMEKIWTRPNTTDKFSSTLQANLI